MIVDTSAIVAIVSGESGAQVLKEALERSPNSRMSAPNYVELCAIMQRRDRPEISRLVDRLLDDYGIRSKPSTPTKPAWPRRRIATTAAAAAIRPVSTSATPTATPWPRSPGSRCCFVAMTSRIPISGPRAPEPRLRYIRYMHRGYALVVCSPGVTRTMIDIDDDLLARAAKELGTTTKKDTVHAALRARCEPVPRARS